MAYPMTERQNLRKQKWMRAFEEDVVKELPQQAGKINWPDAEYMFAIGLTAFEAAQQYIKIYK